jgi:hypothetical protein
LSGSISGCGSISGSFPENFDSLDDCHGDHWDCAGQGQDSSQEQSPWRVGFLFRLSLKNIIKNVSVSTLNANSMRYFKLQQMFYMSGL